MLTIRMARVGKRNKAQFKIMLQEATVAPGGRHIEILGSYDPHQKSAVLKEERIKHWLSRGVQVSDTVHNLLVSKGIVSDKKRAVKLPKKEVPEVAEAKEEAKTEPARNASHSDAGGEIKEEKKVEEKTEEPKEEVKVEETKEEEKSE